MIKPKKIKLQEALEQAESNETDRLIQIPNFNDINNFSSKQNIDKIVDYWNANYGQKRIQSALSKLFGYVDIVPTIQEFIDDPRWLGNVLGAHLFPQGIFPIWRQALYEIYPNPFYCPYAEVICTGSIGSGKTTVALVGALYDLVKLAMLKDPHKQFRILKTKKIVYATMNATLGLAGDVVHDQLYQMASESKKIKELFNNSKERGHSLFRNNIGIFMGSRSSHALGMDVIGSIMDEVNFQDKVVDQAYNNYKAIKRRIESRFQNDIGSYPARVWLVSSKNKKIDFLDSHIEKVREKANVKIYDKPIWECIAHKRKYSGVTFPVFVGDDHRDPKIITSDLDKLGIKGSRIIDVPIEYKEVFEYDLVEALKDIAGISISSVFKYIPSIEAINKALRLKNPVYRDVIRLDFYDKSDQLSDYVDLKNLMIPQYKYCPRYIHIDMGLKKDRLAISSSFVSDTISVKRTDNISGLEINLQEPQFMTEFTIALESKTSSEIPIYKVKDFIIFLKNEGYPLAKVTMDGFQCLVGDTRIVTDRGIIKLKNVQKGDIVYSRKGPNKVTKKWHFKKCPTIKIETTDGITLEGTCRHRVEILKKVRYKEKQINKKLYITGTDHEYEWKYLGDLKPGDVLRNDCTLEIDCEEPDFIPVSKESLGWRYKNKRCIIDNWDFPIKMNPNFAEFLGLYYGDGDIGRNSISIHTNDNEIDNYLLVCKKVFGVNIPFYRGKTAYTAVINSRWLCKWFVLNKLYKKSKTAKIPEIIWKSSNISKAAFLRGLFSADGTIADRDGKISLATSSVAMAQDIVIMLSHFGIKSKIVKRKTEYRKGDGKFFTGYIVTIRGKRDRFYRYIGFCVGGKQRRLEKFKDVVGKETHTRVKTISHSESDVYDLSIENDPSYIANGIMSHNSSNLKQDLLLFGIQADILSCDRTKDPYDCLKHAILQSRLLAPKLEILKVELRDLVDTGKKIDHNIDGSKDLADSLAGSVYSAYQDYLKYPSMKSLVEKSKIQYVE